MKNGNKSTTEDLSLDCRDLAKNPALTERSRRMLAEVADRLLSLERERDAATSAIDQVTVLFFNHCMTDVALELEKWRGAQGEG